MHSPIHFAVFLATSFCVWCVWVFGIKKVFLDIFRERLFELRFELFRLGASEEVPFDSDTYRSLEILFNGLIRFAHRLTAASFFAAIIENARAKRDKDHVDFSRKLSLKISRMPIESQTALSEILKKVDSAVWIYIGFSSFPLLSLCIFIVVIKRLRNFQTSVREQLCSAIEEEVYVSELRYPQCSVA